MHIHIDENHTYFDAYMRIERAKEAFTALKHALSDYDNSHPYKLANSLDDLTGDKILVLESIKPIPHTCAHLASEYLHHLRSALDNMAYNLAKSHQGSNFDENSKVYFPIFDSMSQFQKSSVKKDLLKHFSQPDLDQIEKLRPAKDGIAWFWILSKLNNIDKHRFLLRPFPVTDGLPWLSSAALDKEKQVLFETKYAPPPWQIGEEVVRSRLINGFAPTITWHPPAQVHIHVPDVIVATEISHLFGQLGAIVETVMQLFAVRQKDPEITGDLPDRWKTESAKYLVT